MSLLKIISKLVANMYSKLTIVSQHMRIKNGGKSPMTNKKI